MTPAIEIVGVSRNYGALRPLRIRSLVVQRAERVAIAGIDGVAAEVLVNLLTGATLPDVGDVRIFGEPTAAVTTDRDWLASLDRFGIVSDRAVLLEQMTVLQNLATPFTLNVEPVPQDVEAKGIALAREVGLDSQALSTAPGAMPPAARIRLHVARAIALEPAILLLEHPTSAMPRETVEAFARDMRRVAEQRQLTLVAITEDARFARRVANRALRLHGGTGELRKLGSGLFSRW